MVPELLSAKELAQRFKVSKQAVYLWAEEGHLPHYRLGRSLRFHPDEVEIWLRERHHAPRKARSDGKP